MNKVNGILWVQLLICRKGESIIDNNCRQEYFLEQYEEAITKSNKREMLGGTSLYI